MLKVYCYNRCTTCKKALKWLDDNGIAYESIDIKANHPDEETLRTLYAVSGLPLKSDRYVLLGEDQEYRHLYQPLRAVRRVCPVS